MVMDMQLLSSAPFVVTAGVLLLTSALAFVWKLFNLGERRKLPPIVPGSYQEALHDLMGSESPYRLEQIAHNVGFTAFRLNIPPWNMVTVGDPDVVKEILTDPSSQGKPATYLNFDNVAGGPNIFSSTGFRWKHSRKGTAPAFSTNHVARMNAVCKTMADKMIQERLEPAIEADLPIDLAQEMLQVTLSVICEGAFEYKVTRQEGAVIMESFDCSLMEFIQQTPLNPLRKWFGSFYPNVRRARDASRKLQEFALKVIREYRDNNEHASIDGAATTTKNSDKRADTVIRRIVENADYKNDVDRAADIITFLFAGTDTTSFTTAFTIMELAKHPVEAQRLRESLQSTPESEWTKLSILQNTIRESMRMNPVAALGSDRITGRDFYINNSDGDKMVIPKGYIVSMPQVLTFWNENIFENPHDFNPSRWEAPTRQQMDCFRPFSEGRRSCIGQALANAELTFVVGRLARDYTFEVVNPGLVENILTMKPTNATLKVRHAMA